MPKRVELRTLTADERQELERVGRSRTEAMRRVERANILLKLAAGERAEAIGQELRRSPATVYNVLHRFHERGLASLDDAPRSGRSLTYDEQTQGELIALAQTHPEQLDLPFGHWTLDRLLDHAHQVLGIPISRSRLGEILEAEGLKWYQEQTYFSERPDPQFAQKRGP